jgi:hypothetical protein
MKFNRKHYHPATAVLIITILIIIMINDNTVSEDTNFKIDDGSTKSNQLYPDIAIDKSNRIHATWIDFREENPSLYYAYSLDEGLTFGTNIRINDAEYMDDFKAGPKIIVDDSENIYIAFCTLIDDSYRVYISKSKVNDFSFENNYNIADWTSSDQIAIDAAAYKSNIVYTVWMDDREGNWDIFFTRSTDGGINFDTNVLVNDDSKEAIQAFPKIAVDSTGTIHAIWQDKRNGDFDIYYAFSTNEGASFSKNKLIAGNPGSNQTQPSIAIDINDNIYVTYTSENDDDSDIYLIKSQDEGDTWTSENPVNERIPNTTQFQSSIAVDNSGKIFVVWTDNRTHVNDIYYDVYLAVSSDGGTSFGLNTKLNTDEINNANKVATNHLWGKISINKNDIAYIIWTDNRNNDYDLFLATHPPGIIKDTIPPTINHVPVTSGSAGWPITIAAEITDNYKLEEAILYYRKTNDDLFTPAAMTEIDKIFSANIPSVAVTIAGVEYYISSSDGFNNATYPSVNPITSPLVIQVISIAPPSIFHTEPADKKAILSWNAVTDAAGYNIYRSTALLGNYTKINPELVTDTTYEDQLLTNGVTYYYYLKSVDTNGLESVQSDIRSTTPSPGKSNGDESIFNLDDIWFWIIIVLIIIIIVGLVILLKMKGSQK